MAEPIRDEDGKAGITQAPRPVIAADFLAILGDVDGSDLVGAKTGAGGGGLPPQPRRDGRARGLCVDVDLVGLPLDGTQPVPEGARGRKPVAPRQRRVRNPRALVERQDLHAIGVPVGGSETAEEQFAAPCVLVEIARELRGDERCAPAPFL